MRCTSFKVLIAAIVLISMSSVAIADVPRMINYQGRLTDNLGNALDTVVSMTFTIYDDLTGVTALWTEGNPSVTVAGGLFNVLLGSVVPIPGSVFGSTMRYLGIKVGDDSEIGPRTRMISVAYSYEALHSDTAEYARESPAVADSDWVIDGDNVYRENGNVGIGTNSPDLKLSVRDSTQTLQALFGQGRTSGHSAIGFGEADAANKIFLIGYDHDNNFGFMRIGGDPVGARLIVADGGNVGIGTTNPTTKLEVAGTVQMWGFLMPTAASAGHVLTSSATGVGTWQPAGNIGGSGTINYIPKFTAATTLGNTGIYETDGNVGIGTTSPAYKLDVNGAVSATTYYGDGSHLTGIPPQSDGDWTISGSNIYSAVSGNVGIGTSNPSSMLELRKEVGGATTLFKVSGYEGDRNSVLVRSNGNVLEVKHHGYNTSQKALYVNHDGYGFGAYILGTTYLEGNVGIGTTTPTRKLEVKTSGTGAAIYAESNATQSNIGAVHGRARAQGGSGVYGETWESGAPGTGSSLAVFGWAAHNGATTGGGCIGVMGKTDAYRGSGAEVPMGVYGEAMHTTGVCWGVAGETHSTHVDAVGVKGTLLTAGAQGKAILGVGASPGWAGYFVGRVNVKGPLTKQAGAFKIDHPLDPETKYLYHSSVESPDMMNVYNGNVVLGANGEAAVQLPDYFEALNRNFRYQLTCIGQFAPVYVSEEIDGNSFRVAGGEPGMTVSWQVTGVRKDRYAEANRIQVEVDKTADERGEYMHPAVIGQGGE